MEKIKYELSDGTVCFQDELTGYQDIAILNLAAKIKLDEKTFNESTLISLMDLLVKNNVLAEFFGIILTQEDGAFDAPGIVGNVMRWKNSEYERILTDFFSLNPTAMKLLKSFVPTLGSMNLTRTFAPTETKSESEVMTGEEKEGLS